MIYPVDFQTNGHIVDDVRVKLSPILRNPESTEMVAYARYYGKTPTCGLQVDRHL